MSGAEDIVARLRGAEIADLRLALVHEAADEIERLRGENEKLKKTLRYIVDNAPRTWSKLALGALRPQIPQP